MDALELTMPTKSSDSRIQNQRRSLRKRVSRVWELIRKRSEIRKALLVHKSRYTEDVSPRILLPILCGPNRGRFRKPDNLAIMLIHNRDYKTVLEQSLDYLGIEGYSVIEPRLPHGVWIFSAKIPAALEFARNRTEEYILYADSDDAILIGDPLRAIRLLQDSGGEMLLSTTKFTRYDLMPELEGWFEQLADDAGWSHSKYVHLNSGVFIARRELLVQLLEAAAKYVTDDDLTPEEFKKKRDARMMPEFPLHSGCDQSIYRFVYPSFAERLRLDYEGKLAIR